MTSKEYKARLKKIKYIHNNLELKFFTASVQWEWEEIRDHDSKVPILLEGRETYQLNRKDKRKKDQLEKWVVW